MSHDLRPIRFDMALQILIAGGPVYRKVWEKVDGKQPYIYYTQHYGNDNKPEIVMNPQAGKGQFPFMCDTADLLAADWCKLEVGDNKFMQILLRLMADTVEEDGRMSANDKRARDQGC
jgi:hypothetical protein